MNRNELLNLKRRLIALSLAGGCLVGFTGCSGDGNNVSKSLNDVKVVNDEVERKEQFLCIYEDRAVIIEPKRSSYNLDGSYYEVALDDTYDMLLPMSQYIYFKYGSAITAEDYVALVCGPDFPIEYIRSEDYNLAR